MLNHWKNIVVSTRMHQCHNANVFHIFQLFNKFKFKFKLFFLKKKPAMKKNCKMKQLKLWKWMESLY